nr:MAG TPA: hypothetical protein [Caudoviricetes sp.]
MIFRSLIISIGYYLLYFDSTDFRILTLVID